ncbi:MAG TPA: hypothetical protein VNA19_02750, partial [Pyrinomonadaceae bacterium]|nr:hypothetical protein [Pyrinomonadaceae bacterium]
MSQQSNTPSSEPLKKESVVTELARTARSQTVETKDGAILSTDKCSIRFGGLIAVNELDMFVRQGEIYGL